MKNLILKNTIILMLLLSSCAKPIIYNYQTSITDVIIRDIKKDYFPYVNKSDRDLGKFYVMIRSEGTIINMYFSTARILTPRHKTVIQRTNRFLRLGNYKIPIIFETDFKIGDAINKNLPIPPYQGYFISVNSEGEIIDSHLLM